MAYRVFSTLNSVNRGVDLSWIDMLKSEMLQKLLGPNREGYGRRWHELETRLGRENFERVFEYKQKIDEVRMRVHCLKA